MPWALEDQVFETRSRLRFALVTSDSLAPSAGFLGGASVNALFLGPDIHLALFPLWSDKDAAHTWGPTLYDAYELSLLSPLAQWQMDSLSCQ